MSIITWLLSNPLIATALGVFFAFVAGNMQGRLTGAHREREKRAAEELRAREVADEIDEDIGALPPELARKELREWSKK